MPETRTVVALKADGSNKQIDFVGSKMSSWMEEGRSLFRYVFDVVEQRSTMALFTARADGGSATPAPQDFCKACLWQVMDASIDLRDPNTN